MKTQNIQILKDWDDLLAVFKPSGWLTIPGRMRGALTSGENAKPILSDILGKQLRDTNGSGEKSSSAKPDLFIIHRLDEGTSGAVLFARSPEMHKVMSQKFENGEVKKTYWALVTSTAAKHEFKFKDQIIDAPILKLRSKKNKSVVAPNGKPSQTIVKKIGDYILDDLPISLIEAIPLTGRSHQIRVHLSHIGFPILGDKLYGGLPEFTHPQLHAKKLEFKLKNHIVEVQCQPEAGFLSHIQTPTKSGL